MTDKTTTTAPTTLDEAVAILEKVLAYESAIPNIRRQPDRIALRLVLDAVGRAAPSPAPADPSAAQPLQERVREWMIACFGPDSLGDKLERSHRFLEEALELAQACGCTAGEAHQLVDYVFGRPVGEPFKEVGGVLVTLAALCGAQGIDMDAAGDAEVARIWTKADAIRAKREARPKDSPLPGYSAPAQPAQDMTETAASGMPVEALRMIKRLVEQNVDFPDLRHGALGAIAVIADAHINAAARAAQPVVEVVEALRIAYDRLDTIAAEDGRVGVIADLVRAYDAALRSGEGR